MQVKELREQLQNDVISIFDNFQPDLINDICNIIVSRLNNYMETNVSINKELIKNTPNDQELGGIIRQLYYGKDI